jgi:hypothetical protein
MIRGIVEKGTCERSMKMTGRTKELENKDGRMERREIEDTKAVVPQPQVANQIRVARGFYGELDDYEETNSKFMSKSKQ